MTDIPTWEEFIFPALRALSDGTNRSRRELSPLVSSVAGISEAQKKELLQTGQPIYQNRIGWALSLLTKVGALDRPSRGQYTITDAGRWLLQTYPNGTSVHEIRALGDDPTSPLSPYVASTSRASTRENEKTEESALTPVEQVEQGIARIDEEVAADLLARLLAREPEFFENAVVELLLAMGYGGANGRGEVTQLSGDGGIDGVIDQDVLGLSRVYVQAKRYGQGNAVQAPEVRGFVGAVHGQANSGVFITTSRFSSGAKDFVRTTPTRIVLIDGEQLARLMIAFKVGVRVQKTHQVVEIDEDFFA